MLDETRDKATETTNITDPRWRLENALWKTDRFLSPAWPALSPWRTLRVAWLWGYIVGLLSVPRWSAATATATATATFGIPQIADGGRNKPHFDFFAAASLALAAFFLLLLIITMPRNEPTTAEPSRVNMTGIRIAQTRGGKRLWRGWSSSTNGCACGQCQQCAGDAADPTMNKVHSV